MTPYIIHSYMSIVCFFFKAFFNFAFNIIYDLYIFIVVKEAPSTAVERQYLTVLQCIWT